MESPDMATRQQADNTLRSCDPHKLVSSLLDYLALDFDAETSQG